ncbi:MAG: carbohydrate-binding domain-containing protein [Clostridia bacterium]|nr:carbohydrate-binding domain-containing protein [Clostridia bacterium]
MTIRLSAARKKLIIVLALICVFFLTLGVVSLCTDGSQTISASAETTSVNYEVDEASDLSSMASGYYQLTVGITASDNITVESGSTVTIDLNGQTLTLGSYNITNNGTLTITDTSNDGGGTITYSGSGTTSLATRAIDNSGVLKLSGGTIKTTATASHAVYNSGTATVCGSDSVTIIDAVYSAFYNVGTAYIQSGIIKCSRSGGACVTNIGGTLNISGGTIQSTYSNDSSSNNAVRNAAGSDGKVSKLNISGGTLTTNSSKDYDVNCGGSYNEIYITGGTLTGIYFQGTSNTASITILDSLVAKAAVSSDAGSVTLTMSSSSTIKITTYKKFTDGYEIVVTSTTIDSAAATCYSVYMTENSSIAKNKDTGIFYTTIQAAVYAAKDGETILLCNDGENATNKDSSTYTGVSISLTIDLNGHNLESSKNILNILDGGNVTLTNTSSTTSYINYTGTSSRAIWIQPGGTCTIGSETVSNIVVTSTNRETIYVGEQAPDSSVKVATLNLYGTVICYCDEAAIVGNGNEGTDTAIGTHQSGGDTLINIYDGAVVESVYGTAIYHPQNGTLNIYDGSTITGYATALEARAGTINISGGKFTATSTSFSAAANGSGTTVTGAAVAISPHNLEATDSNLSDDLIVNITGGTFTGYYAVYECYVNGTYDSEGNELAAESKSSLAESTEVTASISGGTFTTTNNATGAVAVLSETVDSTGASVLSITGGSFSGDSETVLATYAAADVTLIATKDGVNTVTSYTGDDALTKAISAMTDSSTEYTIVLGDNYTLDSAITISSGQTITLDLNGYDLTITGSSSDSSIVNNGTLTIKDSDDSGILYLNGGKYGVYNNGSFELSGGTLILDQTANTTVRATGIYNLATIIISGGTLDVDAYTHAKGIDNYSLYCDITISGGTIDVYSSNQSAIGIYCATQYALDFSMTGGTITVEAAASGKNAYGIQHCSTGFINISNGNIVAKALTTGNGYGIWAGSNSATSATECDITITGGTIGINSGDETISGYGVYVKYLTGDSKINISGGEIGGITAGLYNYTNSTINTSVEISGSAEITSINGYGVYNYYGTVTISDSVSVTSENGYGIYNYGTLDISGGEITGGSYGIYNYSSLDISGGSVKSSSIGIYTCGDTTISGNANVTVEGSSDSYVYGIYVYGDTSLSLSDNVTVTAKNTGSTDYSVGIGYNSGSADNTVTINISDNVSVTANTLGLSGYGSNSVSDITITGGTITATNGTGIYSPDLGTLTINEETGNVEITGKDSAVEVRNGSLTIEGGAFEATAIGEKATATYNGSGTTIVGAAIAVSSYNLGDTSVTISGGTFKGISAVYEYYANGEGTSLSGAESSYTVNLALDGGTYTSTSTGTLTAVYSQNDTAFITEGTYNSDVSGYAASGLTATTVGADGYYGITLSDSKVAAVLIDGEVVATYATLTEIFTNLNNGYYDSSDQDNTTITGAVEIRLYADLTDDSKITTDITNSCAYAITLNLNGYGITFGKGYSLTNEGTLTITGNGGSALTFAATTGITNNGTLTVGAGVTVANTYSGKSHTIANYGALYITGGTVSSTYNAIYNGANAEISITGGTVAGVFYAINVAGGSVTISGGYISASEAVIYRTAGTVAINGGYFTDTTAGLYVVDGCAINSVATVEADGVYYYAVAEEETFAATISGVGYADLQSAINAAADGDTVKVVKELDIDTAITVAANQNVILDLNGKTLTITGYDSTTGNNVNLLNYGTLTITDSSTDGVLELSNALVGIFSTGTLNLNGGTIVGSYLSNGTTSNSYTIYNVGTTVVDGGNIESNYYGIYNGSSGNVTIESGTVSGNKIGIYNYSGSIDVTGGTISATTTAIYSLTGTVTIEGGTITGEYGVNSFDTLIISGGIVYGSERAIQNSKTATVIGGTIGTYTDSDVTYESNYGIMTFSGGTTTVSGDTTVTASTYAIYNTGSSTTNLTGGKYLSEFYTVYVYSGTLNISGDAEVIVEGDLNTYVYGVFAYAASTVNVSGNATVTATNSNADGAAAGIVYWGNNDKDNPTTVNISDNVIITGDTFGLSGNGSASYSKVTITGGTITGGALGIYHPEMGTLTISEETGTVTIKGENSAIEIRSGTLNISAGTFISTADTLEVNYNGSGTTIYGAAIAISQHTTEKEISVNISGGTFKGCYAIYETDTVEAKEGSTPGEISANITNGTFEGKVGSTSTTTDEEGNETSVLAISGGSYTDTSAAAYVTCEFMLNGTVNEDGYYTLIDNDTQSGASDVVATIVTDNGTVGFTSLQEAINAASAAGTETTITLLKGLDENITITSGTIIIDLNGKTLTGSVTSYGATLTITDGKESGEVTGDVTCYGGSVTIDAGTFSGNVEFSSTTADITGGTFATDVSAYVATNYVLLVVDDNSYKVVASDSTEIIATIGNLGYSTLQAAINAAGTEETTITLIANTTEDITIENGQNIILDLNDNTITNVSSHTITVESGATLTIIGDGTVDNVTHRMAAIENEGTVILNGGTYTRSKEAGTTTSSSGNNSWYVIVNHGSMTINNGVTVNNAIGKYSSLIDNGWATASDNKNEATAYLTINGGTFIGGKYNIKSDDYSEVTITGGKFTGGGTSAVFNWNKTTISGGEFESDGLYVIWAGADSSTGYDAGEVVITGGTFTAKSNGYAVYNNYSNATVTISDGNFTGKVYCVTSSEATISGGIYSDTSAAAYVVSGSLLEGVGTQTGGYFGVNKTTAYVAQIGDLGYITLQAAINAAANGDTVVLLSDRTESITVDGKKITLDLATYTLTNDEGSHTITVKSGATLTITGDGTVDNVSHACAALLNEGTVILNGGTYTRSQEAGTDMNTNGGNSWYTVVNRGTMTINGGVTVGSYTSDFKDTVGKYSSLVQNGWANSADNKAATTATLIINGGTFIGGLNTIKNDYWGKLTIEDGTFINTYQYTVLNLNDATIKGGTFIASGSDDIAAVICIAKDSDAPTSSSGSLTIIGGTFTGTTLIKGYTKSAGYTAGTSVVIEDGTFTGTLDSTISSYSISGGVYSDTSAAAYVVDGFALNGTVNSDGYYGIIEASTEQGGTNEVVATITTDGVTLSYTSLAAAIAAANNGDVIVITAETITLTETITISGKDITIDLNGNTMTNDGAAIDTITVESGATLTIEDSGSNGTIKSTNTEKNAIQNDGTLTVKGGTITGRNGIKSTSGTVTVYGGAITGTEAQGIYNNGTLYVYGGTITGNNNGISNDGGTATIYDDYGTYITGNNYNGIYNAGTLTVNGGTITGYNSGIYNETSAATVTVNGGTITGENLNGIYNEGTLEITGGTITGSTPTGSGVGGGNGIYTVGGTVTISGATINAYYRGVIAENGATVTVNSGATITAAIGIDVVGCSYVGGNDQSYTTLIVNGGTISGTLCGIMGRKDESNTYDYRCTKIYINDGTITGETVGVYHPEQYGELYIYGGTITGATGVEIRGGTVVIDEKNGNVTIKATGSFSTNEEIKFGNSNFGSATSGIAVAIIPYVNTYSHDLDITIAGGTFTGDYAIYESNVDNLSELPTLDLDVTGGTYVGTVNVADIDSFISGGYYNVLPTNSTYYAAGYIPTLVTIRETKYYTTIIGTAISVPEGKTISYNGEGHYLAANGTGYSVVSVEGTNVANGTATDVGTYTVTLTLLSGYVWKLSDGTYSFDDQTYTVEIIAGSLDLIVKAEGYSGMYDGKEHTGSVTVTTADGCEYAITYSTEQNGNYSDTIPTFSTVGTHTVYYTVTAANHNEETGYFTVEITNADIAATVSTSTTFTYEAVDLSGVNVVATTVDLTDATITYTYNGMTVSNLAELNLTDADEYVITYKVTADNHNDYIGSFTVTIIAKEVEIPTAPATTFTYDGNSQTYLEGNDYYTVKDGTQTDAKTYEVTVTLKDTTNYVWSDGTTEAKTYTWVIEKADYNLDGVSFGDTTVAYDGASHSIELTLTGISELPDGLTVSYSGSGTNVGEYIIMATFTNINANYNDVAAMTAILTISANTVTAPEAVSAPFTYNGSEQTYLESTVAYTVTNGKQMNAGTYTVTVTLNAGYTWSDGSTETLTFSWTIKKATIEVTKPADVTFTYGEVDLGDFEVVATTVDLTDATITYTCNGITVSDLANLNLTEADEYVITYTVTADNHNEVSGTFTVTITNATITDVKAESYTYVYGVDYTAEANVTATTVDGKYTVTYSTTEGSDYTSEIPTFTDVNTYTVYFKISAANYEDAYGSFTVEITKAENSVSIEIEGWTYGEKANEPEVTATYDKANVIYYSDEKCEDEVDIAEVGAGTYYVKAYVDGTANYTSASATTSFVIAKAKVSPSVDTSKTYTYDGSAKTFITLTGDENYTVYGDNTATKAGTYTVTLVLKDSANYEWSSDAVTTYTWTIGKATYDMSGIAFESDTVEYDGAEHSIGISDELPEGVTVSYSQKNITEAGEYTITATFSGDSENYEAIADMTATLTITAKTVAVPTVETSTYTYDGGTKIFAVEENDAYTISGATSAANAGVYTVIVTLNANYTWKDGSADVLTYVFVINNATMTVSASGYSGSYDGSAHIGNVTVGALINEATATIKYGTTSGAYNLTAAPEYTEAGTYVVYYEVTAANYNSVYGSYTVTITEAEPVVVRTEVEAPAAATATYTYTGEAITYALAENAAYTITGATQTDAGSYIVTVTLNDTEKYMWVGGSTAALSYVFVINNATMTVSASGYSGSYDGSAHIGNVTVGALINEATATIKYGTTSGAYNLTAAPEYTEAGTYVVYYEVTAANYNSVYGSYTVTITEAVEPTEETVVTASDSTVAGSISSDSGFVMDVTIEMNLLNESEYELTVTEISNEVINVTDFNSATVTAVYDITLTSNGENVTVSEATNGGKVTVSVAIPTSLVGQNFYIVHIHDGEVYGVITNSDYSIENGNVTFEVEHLSQFAFVAVSDSADADSGLSQSEIITISAIVGGTVAITALLALAVMNINRGKRHRN